MKQDKKICTKCNGVLYENLKINYKIYSEIKSLNLYKEKLNDPKFKYDNKFLNLVNKTIDEYKESIEEYINLEVDFFCICLESFFYEKELKTNEEHIPVEKFKLGFFDDKKFKRDQLNFKIEQLVMYLKEL